MEYLFLSVNAFYQGIKWKRYSQQVTFLRKLEKYGLLSTIFYKIGQFKFNFFYFNKSSLSITGRRVKKNEKMLKIEKCYKIFWKKVFFWTVYQSTSDEVISFQLSATGLEPRTT